jgi:hypothetical protein
MPTLGMSPIKRLQGGLSFIVAGRVVAGMTERNKPGVRWQ